MVEVKVLKALGFLVRGEHDTLLQLTGNIVEYSKNSKAMTTINWNDDVNNEEGHGFTHSAHSSIRSRWGRGSLKEWTFQKCEKLSGGSEYGLETACIHPGYGEFNAHVLDLREENLSLHVGESAKISGTVEGKAFFVGNKTCHYSGNVTLRTYLEPEFSKDSWSYMSGELKRVKGLKVEITPSKTILNPGKSMPFTLKVTPERAGTYYLYVVALSDAGWKSWTLVRVNVS